jgi:YDG domain/MBG domain (YGX type)/Galactose oxidase, central domain
MKQILRIGAALAGLAAGQSVVGSMPASAPPRVAAGAWVPTGDMIQTRVGASAALLPNGYVLVTGGSTENGLSASAERYSASDGSFLSTPPMQMQRAHHTSTLMRDGRVLVIGGTGADGNAIAASEIYDPETNIWFASAPLNTARSGHTTTLLADGRILVAGGDDAGIPNNAVEIFDPALGTFTPAADGLSAKRTGHAAALLEDGRVLIVGGFDGTQLLSSSDLFDANANSMSSGPTLGTPRAGHTATRLLDGSVLIVGGASATSELASSERFNPSTNSFETGASLTTPRQRHLAFLLPHNNGVLIVGGARAGAAVQSAELYQPWNYLFVAASSPAVPRVWGTGSALSFPASASIRTGPADGLLLLTGGSATPDGTGATRTGELFGFATVTTDQADYPPGETVTITGRGWEPGETVALTLIEEPLYDVHPLRAVIADDAGNIVSTEFIPDWYDLGIKFTLTAYGSVSQARTTFTDGPRIASVSLGAQTPDPLVSVNGNFSTYTVTPVRGSNGTVNGSFTISFAPTAPGGITASFSPNPPNGSFTANGNGAFPSRTLTLTTNGTTLPGSYSFTLTAADGADQATTTGTLHVMTAATASVTAATKMYDGNATAIITTCTLSGVLPGDVGNVTCSAAAGTFSNKNVGNGKTVTATGIALSGTAAASYFLTSSTATTTANITPKSLTVSGVTANNKVYDGTLAATVNTGGSSLVGVVLPDVVTLNTAGASGAFSDKNVATAKVVTVSGLTIGSVDAGNYTLTQPTASADITARGLTVGATGVNKVYDGTTNASVTLNDNRVIGDALTASYTAASFLTKTVGTAKTVTISGINVSGVDAGNYIANATAITTADITVRALTVSATGVNKVYDGTTAVTVTLGDDRVVGDVLTTSYSGASTAAKNVGTAKPVSVTGISVSGIDAGNYTFNSTTSTTVDITARGLTVSATSTNKIYDSTTTATVTLGDDRVTGDVLTTSYTSASFADKHVGTAKSVSVTGISLSGSDAGNYTFNSTAIATADITARTLTVSATGVNKVYDGTASATVTLTDDRVVGDVFAASYSTASFSDKNVGTAKPVTVTGISLTGADAANYAANPTATATADITARTLAVSAAGVNKVYDGTTNTEVTLNDDRIAGDVFTTSYTSASFADKNVAAGKTVNVSGISIAGLDSANYSLGNTTATATADITSRPLTVGATGVNKIYDGTTSATVTLGDDRIAGDVFTVSYVSANFADKNVGSGKSVSATGISVSGVDAGNYTFNTTAIATADITPRALTVTAAGVNKVYDGTTAATVTLGDNRVAGDAFTASYVSANFADKNVGTGKVVSVAGISLSGADAGNYTLNTTQTTTADITVRTLVVTGTTVSKVYDGTTAATVTLHDDRVAGDVFATSYTTATFADKNVGTGKTVTVTGIGISGPDAANYNANSTTATTADIIAATVVPHVSANDKIYDGNTVATLSSQTVTGVLPAEIGGVNLLVGAANFSDKNAGTGKTVTATGLSLSGSAASNYVLSALIASTPANITTRTLTVSASGVNKTYDGTAAATVTLSDDRLLGDVFIHGYTTAAFQDKSVGIGKTVNVNGIAISGGDAANYALANASALTTADITARGLTVVATGINKVYDGTVAAAVTLLDNRVAGDVLVASYVSASFSDPNVGYGKLVSVTGIGIVGVDAANYTFNTTASANANILARAVAVAADAKYKVFGASDPPLTFQITSGSLVVGDGFVGALTRATGESVGTYPIGQGSLALTSNYALTFVGERLTIGAWEVEGFFSPVTTSLSSSAETGGVPVYNVVKGGSTVPLKFRLLAGAGGAEITSLAAVQGATLQFGSIVCNAAPASDIPMSDLTNTGNTALRHDDSGRQFIQNWKTPNPAGQCYVVVMTATDGSRLVAYFRTK